MITKKFCPNCGSEDVTLAAGGIMGTWMCKNCGYSGIFPEKEILGRELKSEGKKNVKKKIGRRE